MGNYEINFMQWETYKFKVDMSRCFLFFFLTACSNNNLKFYTEKDKVKILNK